jgi:hypothetical protein
VRLVKGVFVVVGVDGIVAMTAAVAVDVDVAAVVVVVVDVVD